MDSLLKSVLFSAACAFCITACAALPHKALYTESAVEGVAADTANSHFDIAYSIDCCLMPKQKDDFISFKVDTMLYTYRLDFAVNRGMKTILDVFFTISAMADAQNKKNGIRYLGETTLYAYASFENTTSRLIANGTTANHVRFSFLLKDGRKYLLLEGFQVQTLDGKLAIDDAIDSIPFRYEDVKKIYNFFNDTDVLEATRQKQLQISLAAKQAEKDKQAAAEETADIIVNSKKSSAENQ